jgi:hypothetical protein
MTDSGVFEVSQLVTVSDAAFGNQEGKRKPHPTVRSDLARESQKCAAILRLELILEHAGHIVQSVANAVMARRIVGPYFGWELFDLAEEI